MAAVLVVPGLYLSGRDPGRPECVGEAGVRALLVVEDSEPPEAAAGLEAVLHVPLLDQPESDLLSRLDDCVAFIGGARERGGGVLVCCQAGVSRSVAVVTAYLMKVNTLSFEEAYAFVKDIKPDAKINEGFERQLKLYEKMGCEVDVTSPVYKQYRLQKVTEKYPELADLPREVFAVDPNNVHQISSHETVYKCRKCRSFQVILLSLSLENRRQLFRGSSILSHDESKGPATFAHKRFPQPVSFHDSSRPKCTSYFIEPVQWMEPALLGVMEGQLLCPKCTLKLGSFHWQGEQCSCGRWVTPAFQIHKSRVDEVRGLSMDHLQAVRK